MQRRFFFVLVLLTVVFSLLTGCAKKEEVPRPPAPVPQTSAPSPESAAPAPSAVPAPGETHAVSQKDRVSGAHKDFVDAFNAAVSQGNGMDALQARIKAAENAKDACLKMRGEIDDPTAMAFLNNFIDGLQDYADKGHAYAAAYEDSEKLYDEIKKGQDALKDVPPKDQAQAITKINEKTVRYNDLFKTTLPKQRDELEALGKELLSIQK